MASTCSISTAAQGLQEVCSDANTALSITCTRSYVYVSEPVCPVFLPFSQHATELPLFHRRWATSLTLWATGHFTLSETTILTLHISLPHTGPPHITLRKALQRRHPVEELTALSRSPTECPKFKGLMLCPTPTPSTDHLQMRGASMHSMTRYR